MDVQGVHLKASWGSSTQQRWGESWGLSLGVFLIHDGPVQRWSVCLGDYYNGKKQVRWKSDAGMCFLLRGVNVGGKNKVVMSELKIAGAWSVSDGFIALIAGTYFFKRWGVDRNNRFESWKGARRNYEFVIPFTLLSKTIAEEIIGPL